MGHRVKRKGLKSDGSRINFFTLCAMRFALCGLPLTIGIMPGMQRVKQLYGKKQGKGRVKNPH
jgi:hypothetical protein